MKSIIKRKDGQFVIIAALLVAIMMISLTTLLHEAATYYTHEPWDEYVGLIGNVELSFTRLLEISLANYTQNQTLTILNDNLAQWQNDLPQIYPGRGVYVDYVLTDEDGLDESWATVSSFSRASADLFIDISSIGLSGYSISSEVSLNVEVQIIGPESDQVELVITRENNVLVDGLGIDNFAILSDPSREIIRVDDHYNETNVLVYTITCDGVIPGDFLIEVQDKRGVKVVCGPDEALPPPPSPSPTPEPTTTPTPPLLETHTLYPIEDGYLKDLRKNGANKNWNCVNDYPTHDGDDTFVNTFSTVYESDTYYVNHSSYSGTIDSVTVYVTCRYTWGTGGEACTVLRVSGSYYYGADVILTSGYQTSSTTYATNPAGGDWTWAAIEELQCGVSLRGAGGGEARCTQVYVVVRYTP